MAGRDTGLGMFRLERTLVLTGLLVGESVTHKGLR